MGNQQWIHLAVIILVLSMSAISWAIRQFRAYQASQEGKAATQRRREQLLRTGRAEGVPTAPTMQLGTPSSPGGTVHDDARRKLIELAARRQAQLEEMARRAAGGAGPSPPRPSAPLPQRPQAPARPRPAQRIPQPAQQRPQPVQRPQAPRPQRQAETPAAAAEARRQQEAESRRRRNAREQAEMDRQGSDRQQNQRDKAEVQALANRSNAEYTRSTGSPSIASSEISDATGSDHPEAHRTALAAALGSLRAGATTPQATAEAWRRAIILSEILGPSVASREPGTDGGPGRTF